MPSRRKRKRERAASTEATANLPDRWGWNLENPGERGQHVRGDLRLIRQAIRRNWADTHAQRQAIVNAVMQVLSHDLPGRVTNPACACGIDMVIVNSQRRHALLTLSAVGCVVDMESQNQELEHAAALAALPTPPNPRYNLGT